MRRKRHKEDSLRPVTLAVDIGNSTIGAGLFMGDNLTVWKFDTFPLMPVSRYREEFGKLLSKKKVDNRAERGVISVIISSVVPGHTERVRSALRGLVGKEPLIVSAEDVKQLKFGIKSPGETGADRIAASVAAAEMFGAPVAVVDFGTATTVNFVGRGRGRSGLFKGGAILPGLGLMAQALSTGTARLPDVTRLIGRGGSRSSSTEGAILSGITLGTAGAVERIIEDAERMEGKKYKVVFTGGYAGAVKAVMRREVVVEPELVLRGLKLICMSLEKTPC